jgi:hypothetical protein
MAVKMDGKPFTGVTYNQGSFTGDRGHIFIRGSIQCSYSLNLSGRYRVWQKVQTIKFLSELIEDGSICKVCAKKTKDLIQEWEIKQSGETK